MTQPPTQTRTERQAEAVLAAIAEFRAAMYQWRDHGRTVEDAEEAFRVGDLLLAERAAFLAGYASRLAQQAEPPAAEVRETAETRATRTMFDTETYDPPGNRAVNRLKASWQQPGACQAPTGQ